MKEFTKAVNACSDIQVLKNVANILFEELAEDRLCDGVVWSAVKSAYSELEGCTYTEELAKMYYKYKHIDAKVWNAAKLAYTPETKVAYPNVSVWGWVVLYGRMSLNTTEASAIVEACKVFLSNKFSVWEGID